MKSRNLKRLFLAMFFLVGSACQFGHAQTHVPNPGSTYGSQGLRLDLNFLPQSPGKKGGKSGTVEFDCAHASFANPIFDSRGGFLAKGTFVREHGGPIHPGEKPDQQNAHFFHGLSPCLRVHCPRYC